MVITPALNPIRFIVSCVVLACVCWHGAAIAQSANSGLRIEAALGFSDTVRLGNWAPLTVTIENDGKLVDAKLEVDVASGDQLNGTVFTTTMQRDLQLTPGSRKRFQFTVFVNNFSIPLQIRINAGGVILAQHAIDLRQRFTDSRLLLVLSRNADLDYLKQSSARQLRVAYPHPGFLPNQWQGYDGVAAVLVHGVTLELWSERQFQALRKWLGQGGTLVVSGGPDYASLRTARLAELLPAVPDGLTVVKDDENFRQLLGNSFSAPRPFQLHRVPDTGGQTTFSAGDVPLLIESRFGTGRVVYMTFDIGAYPFNGWSGMAQLWLWKLALSKQDILPALPGIETSAMPALFKASGLRFPHRLIVLSFMVAYFGVVAAIYRVVHLGKNNTPWVTWLAPLLFIPVTWLLFVSLLSPAAIHAAAVSVITPLRDGPFARLELDIGLYSNRSGLSSLQIEQSGAVFLPRIDPGRQDKASNWLQRLGTTTSVQALERYPYVLHTLHGSDVIDFALEVSVTASESGLNVKVQNRSHRVLAYAWLVFGGWLYPLGTAQGNADTELTITRDDVVSVHDRRAFLQHLQGLPRSRQETIHSAFAHTVARRRDAAPLQKNEALFVGLPQNPRAVLTAGKRLKTAEVALVMSRVTVSSFLQGQSNSGAVQTDAR